MLTDSAERERALNPSVSFIVQAQAGSGKTELLTRRFLILLACVSQPEEILAMTFTRKSAAEMRTRIILALKQAESSPAPLTEHGRTTWQLAQKVLLKNRRHAWMLTENPDRLRILTLDAFNSALTRQLPIMTAMGAAPDISQNPKILYRSAAEKVLSSPEQSPWSDAVVTLLRHLDNQPEIATELLIKLLERRDQWLHYMAQDADDSFLRQTLQHQLTLVSRDILKNILKVFPQNLCQEILTLARFAAVNLQLPPFEHFPTDNPADRPLWLQLHTLLMTREGEWRKSIDKRTGFPADNQVMKERMRTVLSILKENSALKNAFRELRYAPQPIFQESQWQVLSAVLQILQAAVKELRLSFKQHRQIDYTENTLAALNGLGSKKHTTDLSLAFGCQIRHLLVDEFQDTSATQARLLEKITANWQENDGRTLFLVGDPMQSIYRFREAEVGLFIRARTLGLGGLSLQFLQLSVNFRSAPQIVEWVNQHFPHVFPAYDDIATGAVSYSAGVAAKNIVQNEPAVQLIPTSKSGQQGQKIVALIQKRRKIAPDETIAILVRARAHLKDIIPALKKAGINWCAIGIDPLATRPLIQDLISLTRALLDPTDKVAWLSVLRAPWCGLTLADLLAIAGPDPSATIWSRLTAGCTLSAAGQLRLQRILPVLRSRLQQREHFSLRYQIESAWLLLGGPAILNSATDLKDANVFFNLLARFDQQAVLPSAELLQESVTTLYAAPDSPEKNPVQIMTVHNAKGLEFDTVIIPHLEKKVTADKKQLLLWMERPGTDEQNAFLIAPVHAVNEQPDPIYEYIRHENEIRNVNEQSRLLYVAVTRAKKNLALLFDIDEERKPAGGSLLSRLWPAIQHEVPFIPSDIQEPGSNPATVNIKPSLTRLPITWVNPLYENYSANKTASTLKADFLRQNPSPRQTGIVIHAILQRLCEAGSDFWNKNPVDLIRHLLIQTGHSLYRLDEAINKVQKAVNTLLKDKKGQWIIYPHQQAKAEWAITTTIDQKPVSLVIDRTFVDPDGTRWIIDFKTSDPCIPTDDIEVFLTSEVTKYRKQLLIYRHALLGLEKRPVRMGLYFTSIPTFCEIYP